MTDITQPIVQFLEHFVAALGVKVHVTLEDTSDGPRLNLEGDEAELLVRHRGEPLKALQHIVDAAYGRALADEKRVFVEIPIYCLTL